MTLLDICEPLFRRICELNRMARTHAAAPDFTSLRREMLELLNNTRSEMLADRDLERHWTHLELPLLFFVDGMIAESSLPCASEWNKNRLAYERRELAGDQKFFDLLDEEMADDSADAATRLGVFYTCIGLGFTGYLSDRPDQLRSKMLAMIERVDPTVTADNHLKLCPEAYENVDTRDLTEPSPIPIPVLVSLYLGLVLIFLAVTFFLYQQASIDLRQDLYEIIRRGVEPWREPFRFFI